MHRRPHPPVDPTVGEHELALVVGAPQLIGLVWGRECGSGGAIAPTPAALHQAMAVEHGVDGADGGTMDIRIEPSQPLADLGCARGGLVLFQVEDQGLDLKGQPVGVGLGPARSICEGLEAAVVVAPEDLVAGLARDGELAAQRRHLFPVQDAGDELETLVHGFTRLPGHFALPAKGPIV